MLKKILAGALAAMMLLAFATGCKKEPEKASSSKKPTSSVESIYVPADDDVSSEAMAQIESEPEEEETSSHPYKWTIQTKSAFFRDTDEAKESVTVSETIKQYKNPGTYMIGAYQCRMSTMTAYGSDDKSREKEFADVVKSGYFNCFQLVGDKYFETELKYIAEAGYTFWLSMPRYNSNTMTEESYTQKVREVLERIKKVGCLDLLNGFYWDEPIWTGMSNEDFLTQTKIHYVTFGLRNFPVFATGEFSDHEGNTDNLDGVTADQMKKILPSSMIYLTDVSYDSYGVDVRDNAVYSESWGKDREEYTGNVMTVRTGKDYYRAYKEWLFKYMGHPANFYYYPCAYECNTTGGIVQTADEAYCQAHLEFMAEDLLADERGAGLFMYGFASGSNRHLDQVLVFEDRNGNPTMYPDTEKWYSYSASLKQIRQKFDAKKVTLKYEAPSSK